MSPSTSQSSPLAAFADDAARERLLLGRRYAQLLAASLPAPGEPPESVPPDAKRVAQLKQLAAALGKSAAEVDADAAVIQVVKHHRAAIARAAGSTPARA